MILLKTASMDMLMSYYFAIREKRMRNPYLLLRVNTEIIRRAYGCIVVYQEKRAW